MRNGAVVLSVLAAITFLLGMFSALTVLPVFFGRFRYWHPHTWATGTALLLLFAIVLLLLDRARTRA